jgi:hypothetical protein
MKDGLMPMAYQEGSDRMSPSGFLSPRSTEQGSVERNSTFASIIVVGNAKPATKPESERLEELRAKLRALGSKTKTLNPAEEKPTPPRPYYVDVKSNTYSVLGSDDDIVDDPWNAVVGEVSHGRGVAKIEKIQSERTSSDRAVTQHVGIFLGKLRSRESIRGFWTDTSNLSKLSKLLVYTAASEYWEQKIKFDPLIDSSQVNISRMKGESKTAFASRTREFMGRRLKRFHNLLSEKLSELLTHQNKREESLALAHLVRVTVRDLDDDHILEKDIRSIPKLLPTVPVLRRLGKIPDLKIGDFKSLFLHSEWEIIRQSELFKVEQMMKDKLNNSLAFDDIQGFIDDLNGFQRTVSNDSLSTECLTIKRQRLMFASWWKRQARVTGPMEPLKEFHKHIDESNVKETFNPFRILNLGNIPGSEEGMSHIGYDKALKSWFWASFPSTKVDDLLERAGRDFVSLLNS